MHGRFEYSDSHYGRPFFRGALQDFDRRAILCCTLCLTLCCLQRMLQLHRSSFCILTHCRRESPPPEFSIAQRYTGNSRLYPLAICCNVKQFRSSRKWIVNYIYEGINNNPFLARVRVKKRSRIKKIHRIPTKLKDVQIGK